MPSIKAGVTEDQKEVFLKIISVEGEILVKLSFMEAQRLGVFLQDASRVAVSKSPEQIDKSRQSFAEELGVEPSVKEFLPRREASISSCHPVCLFEGCKSIPETHSFYYLKSIIGPNPGDYVWGFRCSEHLGEVDSSHWVIGETPSEREKRKQALQSKP